MEPCQSFLTDIYYFKTQMTIMLYVRTNGEQQVYHGGSNRRMLLLYMCNHLEYKL